MMHTRYEVIPFEDQQIMTLRDGDAVHVVMKPVAEAIGLAWHGQFERIKRHPVISKGIRVSRIPSVGGMQEAVTLGLEQFHGWLVTISPNHIADEAKRDLVIRYQERAFRVIYDHFHGGGRATSDRTAQLLASERTSSRKELLPAIKALRAERTPSVRTVLHGIVAQHCEALGLSVPPIDDIGAPAPQVDQIVAPFFAALGVLDGLGVEWNHHRDPARMAINMGEMAELLARHHQPVTLDASLREALKQSAQPLFERITTINSRLRRRATHCWVFRC